MMLDPVLVVSLAGAAIVSPPERHKRHHPEDRHEQRHYRHHYAPDRPGDPTFPCQLFRCPHGVTVPHPVPGTRTPYPVSGTQARYRYRMRLRTLLPLLIARSRTPCSASASLVAFIA